jgi:hypothetical protein
MTTRPNTRFTRRSWPRLALACLVTALVATLLSATPAAAGVIFKYDVTGGEAFVKKLDSTVRLGTGTLTADVDVRTGDFTANLDLATAHGEFRVFGVFPVSADLAMEQAGPATGNLSGGVIVGHADVILKLSNVKVAGIPAFVGDNCRTTTPASIPLKSGPGFNPVVGGDLLSDPSFTIPSFTGCKLITVIPFFTDLALHALISGPDNTLKLTIKWAN